MNYNTNNSGEKTGKAPVFGAARTWVFIIAAAAAGALSASPVFSTIFTLTAAALFAYTVISASHPALAVIAPILTCLILIPITKDVPDALICALIYSAPGLTAALFIKNKSGFYTAIAATAVVFALVFAADLEWAIYIKYGSFAGGTRAFFSDTYTAFFESAKKVFSLASTQIQLTDEQIKTFITAMAVILPGVFAAACELLAAALYFAAALISNITKSFRRFFPEGFKIKITAAPALFFIISGVLSLVFSTFSGAEILYYTAFNICVILFLPMTLEGILRIVRKLKQPRIAEGALYAPRMPLLAIGSMIVLFLLNPLFPFIFAAYYGAIGALQEPFSNFIKNIREKNG